MSDYRKQMDPSTLEMFLLLKYNKDLWSAATIDEIINKVTVHTTPPLSGNKRQRQEDDVDDEEDEENDEEDE